MLNSEGDILLRPIGTKVKFTKELTERIGEDNALFVITGYDGSLNYECSDYYIVHYTDNKGNIDYDKGRLFVHYEDVVEVPADSPLVVDFTDEQVGRLNWFDRLLQVLWTK